MNFIPMNGIKNFSISSKKAVTRTLSELDSNENETVVPHFIFATAGYHGIGTGSIFGCIFELFLPVLHSPLE